eukprot:TRINITY_DN3346_c0_g1_i5.p1 TRINITY_DN3346_c0_g1~~TRINITY_DN3346_c0_g1_i5.p1  ORF type:complete len:418 (+),score=60.95 TRINITY_DN3346_c0_g1_i5:76-1329(+)
MPRKRAKFDTDSDDSDEDYLPLAASARKEVCTRATPTPILVEVSDKDASDIITTLPTELKTRIFLRLSPIPDYIVLREVCKDFNDMVQSNSFLWQDVSFPGRTAYMLRDKQLTSLSEVWGSHLRCLDLSSTCVTSRSLMDVAARCPNVHHLDVSSCRLYPASLSQAFARWQLHTLNIARSSYFNNAALSLVTTTSPHLTELDISHTSVTWAGLVDMQCQPADSLLQVLVFSVPSQPYHLPDSVRASSKGFPFLHTLVCGGSSCGGSILDPFALCFSKSPRLNHIKLVRVVPDILGVLHPACSGSLQCLYLTHVDRPVINMLAENFPRLQTLTILDTRIRSEDIGNQVSKLQHLVDLDLRGLHITKATLRQIVKDCTHLRRVCLDTCRDLPIAWRQNPLEEARKSLAKHANDVIEHND